MINNLQNQDNYILKVRNIQKYYGNHLALKDLSFDVGHSRIVGLLGPNGAGKTTAIRVLTTILKPSSGTFEINGVGNDQPHKLREYIGVLPESNGNPENMTGLEYLTYFTQLYGVKKSIAKENSMKLLKEVGLEERERSLISTYSRGMKQRLGIARALINHPSLLFLDEPTLGLDPVGKKELLKLLKTISQKFNTSIILSSHLIDEIEEVCDDVVILKKGEVVAMGSVEEIIHNNLNNRIRLKVPDSYIEVVEVILSQMEEVKNISHSKDSTGWFEMELITEMLSYQKVDEMRNRILKSLIDQEIPITHFSVGGSRLLDVFLTITDEERRF